MTQTIEVVASSKSESRIARAPKPALRALLVKFFKALLYAAVIIGSLVLLWEGYKALGLATGGKIPLTELPLPVAADDTAMPHVWTIMSAFSETTSNSSQITNFEMLINALSVTLREAGLGLILATVVGVLLAVLLRETLALQRGLLPWLVISQTIPLVALAPVIVVWMGSAGLPSWVAVSVIAAYLSFFPIVINLMSGLNKPEAVQIELMQSVSASRLQTLWWLRFPAALPNFFNGLRLAAIASVVGAIVGELAAGSGLGIGRSILASAYYFTSAPQNLFAAVLVASLGGIIFVQVIALIEFIFLRKR